jgi:uncharacterized membrane protein YccC
MRSNTRALVWNWDDAVRCGICTIPAALVVASGEVSKGLGCAIGILPAAIVGMAPARHDRLKVPVVGALFAVSVLVGSLLSHNSVAAVIGIFLIAFCSAVLASRKRFGTIAMTLCAPVAAIGLSYDELGKAAGIAALMLAGSLWSYAVYMAWPERAVPATRPPIALLPEDFSRNYGILLGLAAASSAAVGEAIHTDHVGWATAAAMFVMRPSAEMQQLRSVGRVASVFLGALLAVAFVKADPSLAAVAVAAVVSIAAIGATHESRWYVTPLFGTFLVLTLLLYSDATTATEQWRFAERVGETVLGVGFAYFYGLLVPQLIQAFRKRQRVTA